MNARLLTDADCDHEVAFKAHTKSSYDIQSSQNHALLHLIFAELKSCQKYPLVAANVSVLSGLHE